MKDLESVRAKVEVLRMVKESQKKLKELEADARGAIEAVLGDDEQGTLDGEIVVTWASHKKRVFQQAKLKDANPDLVELFTDTVEGRRFLLVAE